MLLLYIYSSLFLRQTIIGASNAFTISYTWINFTRFSGRTKLVKTTLCVQARLGMHYSCSVTSHSLSFPTGKWVSLTENAQTVVELKSMHKQCWVNTLRPVVCISISEMGGHRFGQWCLAAVMLKFKPMQCVQYRILILWYKTHNLSIYWGLNRMFGIVADDISRAFSGKTMVIFQLKFHLFLRVQLTIRLHWFR